MAQVRSVGINLESQVSVSSVQVFCGPLLTTETPSRIARLLAKGFVDSQGKAFFLEVPLDFLVLCPSFGEQLLTSALLTVLSR